MYVSLIKPNLPLLGYDPQSLEGQIGNTPLLNLAHTAVAHDLAPGVSLLAKAEWFNPGGSVKDRAALNIIRSAEEDGRLRPGMAIFDSTSGNTGIAYAMLGAARGYQVKLLAPDNITPERKAILNAYGAELILTDPLEGIDGALLLARQMAAADPSLFYANQYDNPANWQAHYLTTAPEIWQQTEGTITHFVAGLGTSGTFTGVTRRLREYNPRIRFTGAQPAGPMSGVEGWKHMATAIQPGIYDESLADEYVTVQTEEAHKMARFLARHEGLFVGVSAAAAVQAALQVAGTLEEGVVVTVLPDSGMKYLSESFWSAP
jgi:cysteine synthase B